MEWFVAVVLLAILLFLSGVFSGMETGLYALSRVKLRYRCEAGDRRADVVRHMIMPIGPTIVTILICNNAAAQGLTLVLERMLEEGAMSDTMRALFTTAVLVPLLLLFGEFTPKQLFLVHADRWPYGLIRVLWLLRWALMVPVWLLHRLSIFLQRLVGVDADAVWEPHTSRYNLRTFFQARADEAVLDDVQLHMVDRSLALERLTLVYQGVTKPMDSVESVDAAANAVALRNNLGPTYYARYLVRGHEDNRPQGYVTALSLICADGDEEVGELMQPMPHLPDTTPIHEALASLHANGVDMALVTNADGEPYGITFRNDCLRVLTSLA